MAIKCGSTEEGKERMARFRKRHNISVRFNGVQLKVLDDACRKSSRSSLIREAVMEFLCVAHGSIIPPELDFLDANHKKTSLRFRKLCRSVMTGEYVKPKGELWQSKLEITTN